MTGSARMLLDLLLAGGVPIALATAVVLLILYPLDPIVRIQLYAPAIRLITCIIGGGVAYLFPTRTGKGKTNRYETWLIILTGVGAILFAILYGVFSPTPAADGWWGLRFYFHYYIWLTGLFILAHFTGAYSITRTLAVLLQRHKKSPQTRKASEGEKKPDSGEKKSNCQSQPPPTPSQPNRETDGSLRSRRKKAD